MYLDVEAPRFDKELEDAAVQEGDKALFECIIRGHPEPDVRW